MLSGLHCTAHQLWHRPVKLEMRQWQRLYHGSIVQRATHAAYALSSLTNNMLQQNTNLQTDFAELQQLPVGLSHTGTTHNV